MALANVKQVVFLQPDPTQYMIGKIMYRLSRPVGKEGGSGAPRPISGTEVGMTATQRLSDDYKSFKAKVGTGPSQTPFYKPPGSEAVVRQQYDHQFPLHRSCTCQFQVWPRNAGHHVSRPCRLPPGGTGDAIKCRSTDPGPQLPELCTDRRSARYAAPLNAKPRTCSR